MIIKEEILKAAKLHPSRVHNIYIFGSQVYSTASENSDFDILIIANTASPEVEITEGSLNIHILTIDRFLEQLNQHNIRCLECIMAPAWAILQENHKFEFALDLKKLRHSISHICNNSYVKSKKKILQGDYYLGIKSMFHSLRIAMYGIQIATTGSINDWACVNTIWVELNSKEWHWDSLNERFKPYSNQLLSDFRKVASKI